MTEHRAEASFIPGYEKHLVEVTCGRPAERSLAETDLPAHEQIAVLDTLGDHPIKDVVHDRDKEVQKDDNVEDRAPEEDWPGPERVHVYLCRVESSDTDVVGRLDGSPPISKPDVEIIGEILWVVDFGNDGLHLSCLVQYLS